MLENLDRKKHFNKTANVPKLDLHTLVSHCSMFQADFPVFPKFYVCMNKFFDAMASQEFDQHFLCPVKVETNWFSVVVLQ